MSKAYNVEVSIKQVKGDVFKLIRKFMKKCKKERVIEDYLDRRFYEKPSVKRKREKLKKIKNARKAEAERNKPLETTSRKDRRKR
jgi:ribosomal protein S21|tara:strand:- start:1988 stop:2242 length:255 start_codon:yes stop_codon:yes gene_type:complete